MIHSICMTCGTQFAAAPAAPAHCPICEDERQYVGWQGQRWTTLADLQAGHHNQIKTEEPNLTGIGTQPGFAIAQRALLVQTAVGNLLWDCISLLDDATVEAVKAPNLIPLPAAEVQRIVAAVEPYAFDRIYGAWWDRVVAREAKTAVSRSAARYIRALEGKFQAPDD
ncbi:MAG: hypothetical protein KC425_23155 [Anaerolineales bacterium]|nr:hypothetical protein [Anaerolineales bacterium]